jgi:excisionase family DNA binding protein
MDIKELPRLLKVTDVCALLNLSRSSLYRLTTSKELESVRIGRSVRIPTLAVEAYIAALNAKAQDAPNPLLGERK